MKKDQPKNEFKVMKGNGKKFAGKCAEIREPVLEGSMPNAFANIEEAYADLKNEYKSWDWIHDSSYRRATICR